MSIHFPLVGFFFILLACVCVYNAWPRKKLWQQARVRTLRKNKRVSIKTKEVKKSTHSHTLPQREREAEKQQQQQQQQPSNFEHYMAYSKSV